MRPIVPLVIGLAIGIAGAVLFLQSMPPEKGSAEERAVKLEAKLKKANNKLIAYEAADPYGRHKPGRTLKDGARNIFEDLKAGRPVTPDDIFRATQPLIRDLSPLFERMRAKELQRQTDAKAGELARKYSLTEAQQESLKKWLEQSAADEAKQYTDLISQEGTTLEDMAKAAYQFRPDNGLDKFMESTLTGEKLAAYKSERMLEKVDSVQREADMKVERLDAIVNLDENQRGQVFGVMARGARDFDPAMQFEGLGTDTAPLPAGKSKQEAIMAVLTPAQKETFQAEKTKRLDAARKEMEVIGLTLPEDGGSFDPLDF
jgi:DNA-binding PadR family transcriptional regulator